MLNTILPDGKKKEISLFAFLRQLLPWTAFLIKSVPYSARKLQKEAHTAQLTHGENWDGKERHISHVEFNAFKFIVLKYHVSFVT
jgi:hypothetical protein